MFGYCWLYSVIILGFDVVLCYKAACINAYSETVLGSIPAFSETVVSEILQIKKRC